MTPKTWLRLLLIVVLGLSMGYEVAAKEPIFVRWLLVDDPGDATILDYWERFGRGELSPAETVDLGTMLFYRGYPKDAVRVFHAAVDADRTLYEAWFRIGLVEHQQGNLRKARVAYKRCLDLLTGHGWCNFYLGLLEEQEGNAETAMEHYTRAFRVAPELADRNVNPEVASSELSLGAWLKIAHEQAFTKDLPMPYLEPRAVQSTRSAVMQQISGSDQAGETAPAEAPPAPVGEPAAATGAGPEEPRSSAPMPLAPASGHGSGGAGQGAKGMEHQGPGTQGRAPKPRGPRATPTPVPDDDVPYGGPAKSDDLPYGLPNTRGVSPEAYPGF
jgi:hypothetical protein